MSNANDPRGSPARLCAVDHGSGRRGPRHEARRRCVRPAAPNAERGHGTSVAVPTDPAADGLRVGHRDGERPVVRARRRRPAPRARPRADPSRRSAPRPRGGPGRTARSQPPRDRRPALLVSLLSPVSSRVRHSASSNSSGTPRCPSRASNDRRPMSSTSCVSSFTAPPCPWRPRRAAPRWCRRAA